MPHVNFDMGCHHARPLRAKSISLSATAASGDSPIGVGACTDGEVSSLRHASRVKPMHRFVEHVGEVEVELDATTEAGIFEAALAAFAELVATGEEGESVRHEIELTAGDRALLLVDWLSELLFLAEVEGFIPERVAALKLEDNRLQAAVIGRRDLPRQLVKAVTLNSLELEQHEGNWHSRVVLDV
jgi:SHS2 domain-containing protein